ncbi:MAG TPA: chemotaxis-specific protein-glutamate methyltransferase CheB, partial [Anaerolineae bacterium]|nr:chemotaxis-specific protein-glutamate methyltransferase CheB [Anaerolineae bacterium]
MSYQSNTSFSRNDQAGSTSNKIRVLVVDDSPLARDIITSILEEDPEIEVVDQAENGKIAVERTAALRPDLVTMDIMMPVMDGLQAIAEIMAYHPTPILVVTSSGEASVAYRAISGGALEVMQKPELGTGPGEWERFARRVKLLAQVKVATHVRGRQGAAVTRVLPVMAPAASRALGDRLVAIGASTGGPAALARLLADLPPNLTAGVVVVQHIADGFVPGLVSWLNSVSSLRVQEAKQDQEIEAGTVYIAPTGSHTSVARRGRLALLDTPPVDGQRPAVDALFGSVERHYGSTAVGVLLTGMGSDGARGLKAIRSAGGHTIAQDAGSCVVFGMPRVAVEMDAADEVLAIDQIAAAV